MNAPAAVDIATRPFELNHAEARVLLESSETCATTIATIAQVVMGGDVWDHEMSEVAAIMEDAFDCEMSETSYNKLNAISIAVTTSGFFTDVAAFSSICSALSDGDPADDIESLLDGDIESPAVIWGVQEVGMAYGEDMPEFSPAVLSYIRKALQSDSGDPGPDGEPTYRAAYVREKLADLVSELLRIGAPPALVHEITMENSQ